MEAELIHGTADKMMMRGKLAKDFIFTEPEGLCHQYYFDNWIRLALRFNTEAASSRKGKSI